MPSQSKIGQTAVARMDGQEKIGGQSQVTFGRPVTLLNQQQQHQHNNTSLPKRMSTFNNTGQSFKMISNSQQRRKSSFGAATDDPFNPPSGGMESMEQRRMRNKAATTQIIEWFVGEWATWQRQGFLCGLGGKRCSHTQMNYLLSALEPLFHRDYLLQAGGVYPWRLIGKGKKPIKLEKLEGASNKYKSTRLLQLAKERLKSTPSHLRNVAPGSTFGDDSGLKDAKALIGREKSDPANLTKSNSFSLQQSPRRRKDSTETRTRKHSVETKEISTKPKHVDDSLSKTLALGSTDNLLGMALEEEGSLPPAAASLGGGFGLFGGRKQWLKLKTVQMLDSNTLLGDKDRALPIREILVDGLGIWTGSHLRRTLPLTIPSLIHTGTGRGGKSGKEIHHLIKTGDIGSGVPQVPNHVHFHLKSAIMATTAQSKRVQFDREYTRSSVSFRTENMYTPGGGVEGCLPKTHEEMKKIKKEYKKQLKTIYQWMETLTDVEMGETLSSIVLSANEGDLRLLTQCLIQRHNEQFDVNQLTDSLLLEVMQYLSARDLHSCSQVCHRWHYLANLDALWQQHCLHLGKKCGVESVEELVEAFRLDETSAINQSGGEGVVIPRPMRISLSSIDWKQAYLDLSKAIKEASRQIEKERVDYPDILYGSSLEVSDDENKDGNDEQKPVEPTLLESMQRMMPVIHAMDERGEDKWLERDNQYRYGHLLKDPLLPPGFTFDQVEKEPTCLEDLYDIHSLMLRRHKWKIHLTSEAEERKAQSPTGTESIFNALALEMGKVPLEDIISDRAAQESDDIKLEQFMSHPRRREPRKSMLKLYQSSNVGGATRDYRSEYSEPEDGFMTAQEIREQSLFSFEQNEYNLYLEEKAREKMRRLKEKRSELEQVAHKIHQKKERDREERKKQLAEQRKQRRLRRGPVETKKKIDLKKGVEENSLDEKVAAELARGEVETKSMSRHAGNMSELIHRAHSYLGSVMEEDEEEGDMNKEDTGEGNLGPTGDDEPDNAAVAAIDEESLRNRHILEDYVEEAVVRTLNMDKSDSFEDDSQLSAAERFGSRLGRVLRGEAKMDRTMIGQIGLDVRPPVCRPPEVHSERIVRHYDVQWKYPNKSNPFKGARYHNRILLVRSLKILHGHMDAILCMKISNGRIMTGSMDHSVRVWCNGSGRSMHKLYGHKGSVGAIDFNRQWIVSGSWDMTIMVWDSQKYEYIQTLYGHLDRVTSLQLTDFMLFSGSLDGTIRLWDPSRGFACIRVYEVGGGGVSTVTVWPKSDTPPHKRGEGAGTVIKDTPLDDVDKMPEECIFTTCKGSIMIMDMKREEKNSGEGGKGKRGGCGIQELTVKPHVHKSEVASIKVTGNLIISGHYSGQVRFWNKHTLQCESGIQAHNKPVLALEFHRRKFYSGSADSTIREWDLYTMTCMRVLHGHKAPVRGVKVSDRRIITCSEDGEVRFWELNDPLAPITY